MKEEGTKNTEVIEYGLELTEERHPIIVRERSYFISDELTFMNPTAISTFCRTALHLDRMAEEHLYAIALSASGNALGLFELSHGTMTKTFCGGKEFASRLLLSAAVDVIVVHNHPSTAVHPSMEDEQMADRLNDITNLLDIKMLDFIIIGGEKYFSFAEHEMI